MDELEAQLSATVLRDSPHPIQTCKLKHFPFKLIGIHEGQVPTHFLEVDNQFIQGFGNGSPESLNKFGVITADGDVIVYDAMFARVLWTQKTGIGNSNWAGFYTFQGNEEREQNSHRILIHSRREGFVVSPVIMPSIADLTSIHLPSSSQNEPCYLPKHPGFCKPIKVSDNIVIVPIGVDKLGLFIVNSQKTVEIFQLQSTIMAMAVVGRKTTFVYIAAATEEGLISLLEVNLQGKLAKLIGTQQLPVFRDGQTQTQAVGSCISGNESCIVVGCISKYIFLFNWNINSVEEGLKKLGKKVFPADGFTSLEIKRIAGTEIIAAGCVSGTIRFLTFPEMHPIRVVDFHKSQIITIKFLNERVDGSGQWYLISAVEGEPNIFVWTIP